MASDAAVLDVITGWSGRRPPAMSQVLAVWWNQTAPGSSHSTLAFNPDGIADLIKRLKKAFPHSPVIGAVDLADGGAISTVEDLVEALNEPN
jgi:hypothetical protein